MADIIRQRPFTPMSNRHRELERLFNDLVPPSDEDAFSAVWTPRMDLSENDEAYTVKMDLPGIARDDITLNVKDHHLSICGKRREEKKEEGDHYLRTERSYGSFYRSIALPKKADLEEIEASYENGELTIHVPKAEATQPRRIAIKQQEEPSAA